MRKGSEGSHRLTAFHLSFRGGDPFEAMCHKAMGDLQYGYAKAVIMQMMRVFFGGCRSVSEMTAAMNNAVENVTSDQLLAVIKRHRLSMLPSLLDQGISPPLPPPRHRPPPRVKPEIKEPALTEDDRPREKTPELWEPPGMAF